MCGRTHARVQRASKMGAPFNGGKAVAAWHARRLLGAKVLVEWVRAVAVDKNLVHNIKLEAKLADGCVALVL